jgi:hypothetical protein
MLGECHADRILPLSRRKRKQPQPPAPDIDAAEIPLAETLPRSPFDRNVAVAEVVLRNMIGVVGVVFLGWSAQTLIVLYFFDTMGGIMSIFAALMLEYFGMPENTLGNRLFNLGTALALSAFLAAFIAIPIGFPVLIMTLMSSWSFKDALTQPGFVYGVLAILGMTLLSTLYWSMRIDMEGQRGERALKREFNLLFGRWLFVVFAVYTPLVVFFQFGPLIIVIIYAVVSVYTELYPERFEKIFDKGSKK